MFPITRMRRLRSVKIKQMVQETKLDVSDFVYPLFVDENITRPVEVASMPGVFRLPVDGVVSEVQEVCELGIPAVILFGVPRDKNENGTHAWGSDDVVQRAVRQVKAEFGDDIYVITDVCLCEYTSHGHCGVIEGEQILNDQTLELLGKTAVSQVASGADMVAPSGMMDGMVQAVRTSLDMEGYTDVPIMSYAAKYASNFYGPFRDAADSSYTFGDRSTYQMNPANSDEALREVELDIAEGADIVMVKPALPYLDVLYRIKQRFRMPTAAYHVSGEYSMIKAAAQLGWLDDKRAMYESLIAIKRAGADIIITYAAKQLCLNNYFSLSWK
ncbi:MAG: Delta-aminolevulinic acid dehydratase [Candidatus Argoarchaeum ethanivorans]|uniref:Delta-aminolevulinic acid dehydratase n=1 Tax=Candidatus Argoarchaeum ethanivorans TaxID=2608793 RepID=A0A812A123_9EURY|nr:MAG: Delta-aminolevulinic acid dehydratase [Candidatus Argoarchaeum ethanivorans]